MWSFKKSKVMAILEKKPRHSIEVYKKMKAEIVENNAGLFQVWRENRSEVLRADKLEWLPPYQREHDFMFFGSMKTAQTALDDIIDHEIGRREKRSLKFT